MNTPCQHDLMFWNEGANRLPESKFVGYAQRHKWLNVPYDSGLVFCRDPEHLRRAMAAQAAYLVQSDAREPNAYTPELSRRARGVEVWAALRSL